MKAKRLRCQDPRLSRPFRVPGLRNRRFVRDGDQTSTVYNALQVVGTAEAVLDTYWDALDENNRVSLAVKEVESDGSTGECLIRNRHA